MSSKPLESPRSATARPAYSSASATAGGAIAVTAKVVAPLSLEAAKSAAAPDAPTTSGELASLATSGGVKFDTFVKRPTEAAVGFYPWDGVAPGKFAMTIDDGPLDITAKHLDTLKEFATPATFFVCGRSITKARYPLIRRMLEEGHSLGDHTQNHDVRLVKRSVDGIMVEYGMTQAMVDLALSASSPKDFEVREKRIVQVLKGDKGKGTYDERRAQLVQEGVLPETSPYKLVYSRPPGGGPFLTKKPNAHQRHYAAALEKLGMMNMLWNIQSIDGDDKIPYSIRLNAQHDAESVLKMMRGKNSLGAQKGGVILMHDCMPVGALRIILQSIKARKDEGYEIVPLDTAMRMKYAQQMP